MADKASDGGWRVRYTDGSAVFVGHEIRFDHFGAKDRVGKVVRITASSVHVEWTAPSSGKTRVVKVSTKSSEWAGKNPRREPRHTHSATQPPEVTCAHPEHRVVTNVGSSVGVPTNPNKEA